MWKKCTMVEAFNWGQGKQIVPHKYRAQPRPGPSDGSPDDYLKLSDGSFVACASSWTGPYSEVTPDIDSEAPKWWIWTPDEPVKSGRRSK